jgi:DMSO/TMAO reductase YedYZ molybdopterin-dependent catalytic subunit
MKSVSRRGWIMAGVAAGSAAAYRLAAQHNLLPPDGSGIWAPGHSLTYGVQRMLTRHSLAREFPRGMISPSPFANGGPPGDEAYGRHQAAGFADWRLAVDGLVARPAAFSVADLRSFPARRQITHLACEEGWSFIAEWTGVPLSYLLEKVGAEPAAKYVVYFSIQTDWWDSVDIAEAVHPQTLIAYGMNGGVLPPGHGGPLRVRVPRQLGYKSVKYITRLTVTDSLKEFGRGMGSSAAEFGYSWYNGI